MNEPANETVIWNLNFTVDGVPYADYKLCKHSSCGLSLSRLYFHSIPLRMCMCQWSVCMCVKKNCVWHYRALYTSTTKRKSDRSEKLEANATETYKIIQLNRLILHRCNRERAIQQHQHPQWRDKTKCGEVNGVCVRVRIWELKKISCVRKT